MSKKKIDSRVGDRIRKIRDSKGYSQEYLAEEIGMSAGNLGKIERAEIDPKTTTLYKIAKTLKVDASDFFEQELIADPKEKFGLVTRDEFLQGMNAVLEEIAKLREQLIPKTDTYKKPRPARRKRNS